MNRLLHEHPGSLDAVSPISWLVFVERDISASSSEFHALHLAITRLTNEDAKDIDESRLIKDRVKLSHES